MKEREEKWNDTLWMFVTNFVRIHGTKYQTEYTPGCANWVSDMIHAIGHEIPNPEYWVPAFLSCPHFAKVRKGMPGDLVVWDKTYDAVYPPGIGPEDTMTHIGICSVNGWCWHYSRGEIKRNKIVDLGPVNCYLRLI